MLGVHLIPNHWDDRDDEPQSDRNQMRRLQPKSLKVINPDGHFLRRLYEACPRSLFVLRDHPLSEQKDDVARDPQATGVRHAQDWIEKLNGWQLPIPREQLVVLGINEPPVWDDGYNQAITDYTVAFLDHLAAAELRGGALNLSVGWPANHGPDTPPDWTPYAGIEAAIQRGRHFLFLHEYWNNHGPLHNWGWWCGRYEHCPWDVPIIIGETGIDQYVSDPGVPADRRGWKGQVTADQYLVQLAVYGQRLRQDPRIHSYQPFTYDFSHPWDSFDVRGIAHRMPVNDDFEHDYAYDQAPTRPPGHGKPTPPDPVPVPDNSKWVRAISFVLRWEGGYVNNPADPGGETNWGISKRSYPHLDIKALTKDEAIAIYHKDYWLASGAGDLDWPLCLVHFDAAVNHGVGQARVFLADSGDDARRYIAQRLRFYAKLSIFPTFGPAWTRRMADLLDDVAL